MSPIFLFLILAGFLIAGAGTHFAQRPQQKLAAAAGVLKVQVPSGVLGDNFWIYLNGRLRSSPPHGTQRAKLNIVFPYDGSGNWEGFGSEGLAVSSARIDQYLRSGDPYGIFRAVEFQVPPGSYTVEVMVPSPQRGAFLSSSKSGVLVQARKPTEIYTVVPAGFSLMPLALAAPQALGYALCLPSLSKFDINAASDQLLKWGLDYRNDPLRQSLLKAAAAYRPGDGIVTLDVDSGPREYDGRQIQIMLQRFYDSPFSRGDVAQCRKLLPQYASAFDEFDATIDGVYRDRETLGKLAADLSAARKSK